MGGSLQLFYRFGRLGLWLPGNNVLGVLSSLLSSVPHQLYVLNESLV